VWSSRFTCRVHGEVLPVPDVPEPSADWARHVSLGAQVPVWLPWPLPQGWVVSGIAPVGDEVTGVRAVAVVLTGPHPMGGPADMLLLSEEPGVGLGARLTGLDEADPRPAVDTPAYTYLRVGSHPVPMWLVPAGTDCAAVVGERDLAWLWLLVRPASAGPLLVDHLGVADARDLGEEVRLLPYGARTTWLDPPG
jgi:hypothetical protein